MPLPRHVQSLPPHPLAILDHLLVEVEVFEEPKSARKILINITNMEVQLLPQNFYFRPTEPTAGGSPSRPQCFLVITEVHTPGIACHRPSHLSTPLGLLVRLPYFEPSERDNLL